MVTGNTVWEEFQTDMLAMNDKFDKSGTIDIFGASRSECIEMLFAAHILLKSVSVICWPAVDFHPVNGEKQICHTVIRFCEIFMVCKLALPRSSQICTGKAYIYLLSESTPIYDRDRVMPSIPK